MSNRLLGEAIVARVLTAEPPGDGRAFPALTPSDEARSRAGAVIPAAVVASGFAVVGEQNLGSRQV